MEQHCGLVNRVFGCSFAHRYIFSVKNSKLLIYGLNNESYNLL